MGKTPVNRQIIDNLAQEMGVTDFSRATIREIKAIASKAEAASGVEFIKMLCRHSVQNVVEVLLFATARQMVVRERSGSATTRRARMGSSPRSTHSTLA